MAGGEDINMVESPKSKLDIIMNTLNALSYKTIKIEGVFIRFYSDARLEALHCVMQPLS